MFLLNSSLYQFHTDYFFLVLNRWLNYSKCTYRLSLLSWERAEDYLFELVHHGHCMRAYIIGVRPDYSDLLIFTLSYVFDEHRPVTDCEVQFVVLAVYLCGIMGTPRMISSLMG